MADENGTTETDPTTADAAPAKPARKRAPRKAAAKAPAPAESVGEGALAEAALEGAPAAPAKRTRARKATAPAAPAADAAGEPAEGAGEEPAPAKPAKRTRARKAPAPVTVADEPAEDEEEPAEGEKAGPAAGRVPPPPVVMFQAPVVPAADVADEEEAPAPRARRERKPRIVLDPADAPPAEAAGDPAEPAEQVDETDGGEDEGGEGGARKRRRRGRRGRGRSRLNGEDTDATDGTDEGAEQPTAEPAATATATATTDDDGDEGETDAEGRPTGTRRRRRRRRGAGEAAVETVEDGVPTVVKVRPAREPREPREPAEPKSEIQGVRGSTRLEAKRQRRRDGRDQGRRRPPIVSEAEFLARRESVDRVMLVRQTGDTTQIAVLEDDILVEHYVTRASAQSYAGNVYLGRVQNVLPSMEAAFVDIGKGRNAVLYAGEVNYDASALEGRPPRIEQALKSGQQIVVQVTKDPMGHKGARLTSQISLPGRYMVYVPEQSMTGISRKLPDTERARLKSLLKQLKPEGAGVIIRTAAEGASEEDLTADLRRLQAQWEVIEKKAKKETAPALLHGEPDLVIRVVRDNFNEDFTRLVVEGAEDYDLIEGYLSTLAPDLMPKLARHEGPKGLFETYRVDEQIGKALDRKVSLPSGGSLVIDRTEAMTVVDVNTGKFTGKGGNLEETVTKNNLEAAEEIVRQMRLRDIGGIIVVDFIDMILESNRELVTRRLKECLGRDRTKHQVAELTSLGLLQMTRKRISQGLFEAFTEQCAECGGRGVKVVKGFANGTKQKNGGGAPTPAQVAKRKTDEPSDERPDGDRANSDRSNGDREGGRRDGEREGRRERGRRGRGRDRDAERTDEPAGDGPAPTTASPNGATAAADDAPAAQPDGAAAAFADGAAGPPADTAVADGDDAASGGPDYDALTPPEWRFAVAPTD
ncbi:MAG TPA: Rne/Rng family ribonuclease [Frankiaceae bacterium]|nr:Rne/Rng family ribonuclease [Frankiaceae bacterium]